MQKTDFDFEFIIGEDFSTDGTREIVFEYAKKYPDKIRVITSDYNVGVKSNGFRCIRAQRGKYLTICEGDDYWTDPHKLQKQVDFMEKHPNYALCFHPVKVFFEDATKKGYVYPEDNNNSKFTLEELLRRNYIQTNSVMYRAHKQESMPIDIMPGDWYMHLYYAQFGRIGFINETMSVYRRHSGGIWWNSHSDRKQFWNDNGVPHIRMFEELMKLYGNNRKYKEIITESIFRLFDDLIVSQKDTGRDSILLKNTMNKFPEYTIEYMLNQSERLQEKQDYIADREKEIIRLQGAVNLKDQHIQHLEKQLRYIKNNPVWKVLRKTRYVGKRIKRS